MLAPRRAASKTLLLVARLVDVVLLVVALVLLTRFVLQFVPPAKWSGIVPLAELKKLLDPVFAMLSGTIGLGGVKFLAWPSPHASFLPLAVMAVVWFIRTA